MQPPNESAPSLYDDPRIYDILMTPGTAAELDVLQRIEKQLVCLRRRLTVWLEPACGTGRFLRLLAGRGQRVIGFDRNAGQLAYARSRLRHRGLLRRVRLYQAEMTAFDNQLRPASVDFAFNPVNSLRHLLSDDAMLSHFAQMARVLRPGGLYVVGISLRDDAQTTPEEDVWVAARGRCRVTQLVTYLPPATQGLRARRETVISHLMVERPGRIDHHDVRYELRTYREQEWKRLLARSFLRRLAVLDARGRPLRAEPSTQTSRRPAGPAGRASPEPSRVPPYQLEVLTPRT